MSLSKSTYHSSKTIENFLFSSEKTISKKACYDFLYEKENHLGNVLVTLSDRKLPKMSSEKQFYWDFESSSADEVNNSGIDPTTNTATFVSSAGYDGSDVIETNTGNYIEYADDARLDFGANDFTVAVWAKKVSQLGWGNAVVGKWNSGSISSTNEWLINLNTGSTGTSSGPAFLFEVGSTLYTASKITPVTNLGQWYFLVGKREGNTISIYVDGVLEDTETIPLGASVNNISGRKMMMGKVDNGVYGNMQIDNLMIFNEALSDEQIASMYSGSLYSYYEPDVKSYSDYYPFGSLMPGRWSGTDYRYGYNTQEKDDEISGVGNHYNAKFWEYDPRIVRRWEIDPAYKKYPGLSPYSTNFGNPIWFNDPFGNDPNEYEQVVNDDGSSKTTMISDLGGDEVDFTHFKGGVNDGKTEISSRTTGESVMMKSNKNFKGFTLRENGVNWNKIYNEFLEGDGPENSLITSEGMWKDIMKSPQFADMTQKYMDAGTPKKHGEKAPFGIIGAVKAGSNATAQVIGKSVYSFYNVGDKLVIFIMDSKSVSSYSFDPLVKLQSKHYNYERVTAPNGIVISGPESTTRQTYMKIFDIKQ